MKTVRTFIETRSIAVAILYCFGVMAMMIGMPTDASAGDEVLIGATAASTGKYANSGKELINGYTMWVEEVNARGGLLGRKVKLIHEDDESNPDKSAEIYERMITSDKVDLLLGPYSSGICMKASTVAEAHNFPLLATTTASNKIWARGYKNVFGSIAPAATWMDPILDFAKSQGLSTVAVIFADTAFPKTVAKGTKEKADSLGLKVVFEEAYPKKNTDFIRIIEKMKAVDPDVIIGGTYLPDSVAFLRQAKEHGLNAKILAFTVGPIHVDFWKKLGSIAEGVMAPAPWVPTLDFPGVKSFVEKYEKRHGYKPGAHAGIGYGGGHILEAAVKKAGSLDKDKLRKTLSELDTTTTLGHYKVDKTGANIAMSSYVIQWSNGKKEVVLPQSAATRNIIYPFTEWNRR